MKENIPCITCGAERMIDTAKNSIKAYKKRAPRCRKCAARVPSVVIKISKGWFPKGVIPWSATHKMPPAWNKGVTGYMGANRTSFKTETTLGIKNYNWKGNRVGYHGLHSWVIRQMGKAKECKHCGKKEGRIEWANKSREYKREINDWISLCKKCHGAYDSGLNWGAGRKRFKLCA